MEELTDESPMPYGKHKGVAMANVPADYLLYMYNQDMLTEEVSAYVEDNMDVLEQEVRK
jgi:uncharacterized protein (DUF3820 family)